MRAVQLALLGLLLGLCAGGLTAFAVALLRARRPSPYLRVVAAGPVPSAGRTPRPRPRARRTLD